MVGTVRFGSWVRAAALFLATITVAFSFAMRVALARPALQAETEVSPDATPQITLIKPAEGAPGSEVSVIIEGVNFAPGVYIAFLNPGLHAVSTKRQSARQLEARIQIGPKAQPGPITLYVSNPASAAAQGTFTVTGQPSPTPGPTAIAPVAPATPTPGSAEITPSTAATPQVTAVDPPRVARGNEQSVKLTGKNFMPGARVAFSNPGVRVLGTQVASAAELSVQIRVAPDADMGKSSLFVINPGDQETEAPFEIADAGSAPTPAPMAPAKPAAPAQPVTTATGEATSAASVSYDVYNLGEITNIFQSLNKPKGTLKLAGGKLRYEEAGKEVFAAGSAELKEIEMNVFAGFNTGTFHVILNPGKTYNFAPASLKAADSQAIVDAVRRALH